MKAIEGTVGRVFVLRLEDGDVIPDSIELFALENSINVGQVVFIGGVDRGQVVAGPRGSSMPPDPMLVPVEGPHETIGVGLLAPDQAGVPRLHIHGALGRAGHTTSGCLRYGVTTWFMVEAIIFEILASVARLPDERSGLSLLQFD